MVRITYEILAELLAQYTAAELRALSEQGALANKLRQLATLKAENYGLAGTARNDFITQIVTQLQTRWPAVTSLADHWKS